MHGPEVGFTRRLHEQDVRNVAIIKVFGNFQRDVQRWPWAEGEPLFERWTAFVDRRLAELEKQGLKYSVRGFVWHQGIDDAIHGKLAGRYGENLAALVRSLRKRYAEDDTPWVLARSVDSPIAKRVTGAGPEDPMAIVRRAQTALPDSVPFTAWIDVDDLPRVVEHHFPASAQLEIGKRFADAYLALRERK